MRTTLLRRFIITFGLLIAFAAQLCAAEPNESNLTLLDTESPAIKDLAAAAGDLTTYDLLKDRNKIGVFFSEKAMDKVPGTNTDRLNLQLLNPWEEKNTWTKSDFLHSTTGPMFFMNDGRYQVLAVNDLAWYSPASTLTWRSSSSVVVDQFKVGMNNASAKVQVHKRFEFPTSLDYPPQGSGWFDWVQDYDTDRATVESTARKLVIVIHGWNTSPDTDPYAGGNWPTLMKNLSREMKSGSSYASDWDLYAYRWGRDSYTGNLYGNSGAANVATPDSWYTHAAGQVGLNVENGTQAAEIGYQHGLVLGKLIREHCIAHNIPLEKVHFIAHSAGTWVARSASLYLNATRGSTPLVQQITLLDPYNPNVAWIEKGQDVSIDNSELGTDMITDKWVGKILPSRAENIYSRDKFVLGTNERYWQAYPQQPWQQFVDREVGASLVGYAPARNWIATKWDDHSGPINFYAYTVNPSDDSASTLSDRTIRKGYADGVGWEHSLFMKEYRFFRQPVVIAAGYSVSTSPVYAMSWNGFGPAPAPALSSPWKQILVDVDDNSWVRAMLIPTVGGAAEMAGPVRLRDEGTFSINLTAGQVLTGAFDVTVTPAALTLSVDGVPFGQKEAAAQGAITQRGFDAEVNSAGNVVFSLVLANGTTGMSVTRDAANTGWEASGLGVVNENGAFAVAGGDGLQITGQMQVGGGIDPQAITVAPPQIPEIHVQDGAGGGLISGASSQDCGSVGVGGTSSALSLTIRNTGTVDLTGLGVIVEGEQSGDFSVNALGTNSLAPDGSVVLMVTFSPSAAGSRTATLRISSNDANESPYEITLTGKGFTATPLASASAGTNGLLAAGAENFFRVNVTEPGCLIFWTEGGTDTIGTILSSGGMALAEDNDSGRQGNLRVSTAATSGAYFIRVKGFDASAAGAYTLHSRLIPATAPVQISLMEKEGDDVSLGFTNVLSALYRIEHSGDLQNWLPIENVAGNGAERLLSLPGLGSGATGFFRVGFVADGYNPNVAVGMDRPLEVINSGGDATWFSQSTVSHDGADAARSGQIYDGQTSSCSLTAVGPGTVSFWQKVSSADGDFLRFLIDGVEQPGSISGETGWLQASHSFGAGNHTLEWAYTKDDSGSSGADCGWVDEVVFLAPEIAIEQPAGNELTDGGERDFGTVAVGSNNQLTFTIKNTGTDYLTGLSITKDGAAAGDFNVGSIWGVPIPPPGFPLSLAPGVSAFFTVNFSPSAPGTRSAAIHIASNDADENPFDINLSGTGLVSFVEIGVEQPAGADLVDGGTKDFGSVASPFVNFLTFTVKNTGSDFLTGLGASIDGANPSDFYFGGFNGTVPGPPPNYSPSIAPGGSATFMIVFSPQALGSRSAAIHIVSNDADENPFDINLSGTGVIPIPEIAVEQPVGTGIADGEDREFGTIAVGVSKQLTFTVKNTGTSYLDALAVTLDGTNAADFAVGSFIGTIAPPPYFSPSIAPGGSATFAVTFTPSATGARSATIHIASNDTDENPFDISLGGTGAESFVDIAVEQPVGIDIADGGAKDYGALPVGSRNKLAFTVKNSGTDYLTGLSATIDGTNAENFSFDYFSGAVPGPPPTYSPSIAPGGSATFTITFSPYTLGAHSAAIHISSNDADENPFDINLSGTGVSPGIFSYLIADGVVSITGYNGPGGDVMVPDTINGLPVTAIGSDAFAYRTSLTRVTIPSSVATSYGNPFVGCVNLVEIIVVPDNPYLSSLDGVLFNKAQTTLIQYPTGKSGSYVVPGTVTTIGDQAFEGCVKITEVTIPASVTSIGTNPYSVPFNGCTALVSITVAAGNPGFSSVGGVLFNKSLSNIIRYPLAKTGSYLIPEGVTGIGHQAFEDCFNITDVTIPSSVVNSGLNSFMPPFMGCSALMEITVDPGNINFSSLGGILFNKDMTTLIRYPSALAGGYSIPVGVTGVGSQAFTGCSYLTDVTFPSSITAIESGSFGDCGNLTGAVFRGDAPLSMGFSVFYNAAPIFKIYFTPDGSGFTSPTWAGYSTVLLSATQEIIVTSPEGILLTDGDGVVNLGNAYPGSMRVKTFTVTNMGSFDLTGLAISKDGTDAGNFVVGAFGTTTLIPGKSATFTVNFSPSAPGTRSAAIHIASNDADENPFDIELVGNGLDPALDVAAGIDLPGTSITPGGQADWFWQNAITHDNTDASQSGDVSDSQNSTFSLSATGPGTVSFWWKVSSEAGWDYLRFYIDGVEQSGKISGEVGWEQKFVTLGSGSHTLQWAYTKDEVYSSGTDCGWVDQVVLPATGTALQNWRQTHFGTTADSGEAADVADPDRDGLKNLVEFAFGLNPSQNSAHLVPKLERSGNNLTCTFTQPAGATGITYGAEWTNSLTSGSWQAVDDTGVGPQHTFSIPIDGNQKKFVRFKVVAP